MNRIRNIISRMDLDFDDEINNLFEQFIEEVNEIPFNTDYENTPEFLLNQSIVNNAYLLRRTIELYPQEQRHSRRRSERIRNRLHRTNIQHTPVVPLNTPTTHISFSDDDDEGDILQRTNIIDERLPELEIFDRRWRNSSIWNPIDLQLAANSFTDTLFTSLFTNFNQFMEQNLNDLEDVKVTLSDEEFEKLELLKDETLIENKQCNICLEDLTKEDMMKQTLRQLKCQHIYHNECIKEWLTKQSTKCPTCRMCCRPSTNSE